MPKHTTQSFLRFWMFAMVIGASEPASGLMITLDATNRGTATTIVFPGSPTADYRVGNIPPETVNNYFVFDLRGITETITSASFRLYNPPGGFATSGTSETVTLLSGTADLSGNFSYGGSSAYGSRAFTSLDNDTFVTFDLGAKFLLQANALRGSGLIGFYGRMDSLDTATSTAEYLFFGTAGTPASNSQLILTTVPEPATLILIAMGALTLRTSRTSRADVVGC